MPSHGLSSDKPTARSNSYLPDWPVLGVHFTRARDRDSCAIGPSRFHLLSSPATRAHRLVPGQLTLWPAHGLLRDDCPTQPGLPKIVGVRVQPLELPLHGATVRSECHARDDLLALSVTAHAARTCHAPATPSRNPSPAGGDGGPETRFALPPRGLPRGRNRGMGRTIRVHPASATKTTYSC